MFKNLTKCLIGSEKSLIQETLMSQRVSLLHLKMQEVFFKFAPSLPLNFWW